MQRREFIKLVGGAAYLPLVAHAQSRSRLPTIGVIGAGTQQGWSQWTAAFLQRLRELGWIEGRTVTVEYRWADGRGDREAEIASEFTRLKVDVILTVGGISAKQATSDIPIVFAISAGSGWHRCGRRSARPGGNILDFRSRQPIWLELLKQVAPGVSLVAVLLKPDSMPQRAKDVRLDKLAAAGQALGVQLQMSKRKVRLTSTGPSRKSPRRARVVWSCCQRPHLTLGDSVSWT